MEEEIWHRLVFILSLHICPEEISGFFCMVTEEDIRFMERALDLARRGEGWVNPNPLVGAVIVPFRGVACGAECVAELQGGRGWGDFVCDFGAVLPLREDAALHRGDSRSGSQTGGCGDERSESVGGGEGDMFVA